MPNDVTLNFAAPLTMLSLTVQRTMDFVGHALRAIENYRPSRDHALPAGVIASFGVNTDPHVPRTPIALQVAASVPLAHRSEATATWILLKGLSDLITGLSTFALQHNRLLAVCDALRHPQPTLRSVHEAAATDSVEARKYDRSSVPQKVRDLRTNSGLEQDPESGDLEMRVLSINNARNCLEHRGAVVGPQDCAPGTDELVLEWVGPDFTDGRSAETIKPGELIESLHVNLRAKRSRAFKRGTVLTLSAREFVELCWTVNAFGEVIQRASVATLTADKSLASIINAT